MLNPSAVRLMMGWTTTSDHQSAELLANGLISSNLAVCVHLEGPIISFFRYKDRIEKAKEYKLTLKFLHTKEEAIQDFLQTHHPYDIPAWVALNVDIVSQSYLDWAGSNV